MADWDRTKVWVTILAAAATFIVAVIDFLHDVGLLG